MGVKMELLKKSIFNSLDTARYDKTPFPHYLVHNILTETVCQELLHTTSAHESTCIYDGTRAGDSGGFEKNNTRFFLTSDVLKQYSFLEKIIIAMQSSEVVAKIASILSIDLSNCYLRVEYIVDKDGFYLVPHQDIIEKRVTLFIYLGDSPEHCGTDLYDSNQEWCKTIPFKHNTGYMFAPGENTWHGFEKKEMVSVRQALLLNYVTFKTDWPLGLMNK